MFHTETDNRCETWKIHLQIMSILLENIECVSLTEYQEIFVISTQEFCYMFRKISQIFLIIIKFKLIFDI